MNLADINEEIGTLKDKGDSYVSRGLDVPTEIWKGRQGLAELRWGRIPQHLKEWCAAKANVANIANRKDLSGKQGRK